jgi:hypothetical protein
MNFLTLHDAARGAVREKEVAGNGRFFWLEQGEGDERI